MSKALKKAIIDAAIPQYEVARRTKISETRLSRLVTGRASPTDEERTALATVLGAASVDLPTEETS